MSATLSHSPYATRVTGIAAAAISIGRALETWGRTHARRRHEQRIDEFRLRTEATAAINDRDQLIRSTTYAPLF